MPAADRSGRFAFILGNTMDNSQFQIPGGWKEQEVAVGPRRFQILAPADPDAVLESMMTLDKQQLAAFDPYWAQVWPAVQPLAAAILRRQWPPGTCALELGCGVGLVGVAALAAGLRVTFSDHVELALSVALHNARRNGFPHARTWLFNWREPVEVRFPVVLASDVLYDDGLHTPLLNTLEQVIAREGVCWMGDPGRTSAAKFLNTASRGFAIRLFDADDTPLSCPCFGQFYRIELRRKV